MAALRFSGEEIKAVSDLVALHLRFHGYSGAEGHDGVWTDAAVRRYVRDAGVQLTRLHILTRADCTTRDTAKAERLRSAYDDLERRIGELAEQEELKSIRPDLNGSQIMEILGIPEGRDVGRAYAFLLERRMEEGPLGEERAREELLAWWANQRS
jgi:poly(A) polymerase